MLLGDSAVGKTCVLVRFKDGAFLGGNFIATVGIDFRVREMSVDSAQVLCVYTFIMYTLSAVFLCSFSFLNGLFTR